MRKKLLAATMSAILAFSLAGCSAKPDKSSPSVQNEVLKIGILQLVEHPALDSAREGFIKALSDNGFVNGDNIELDIQNAQADQSNLLTMSQRFVNNKSDLILAIATGSAQSLASQTKEIPILITAVTDPVKAGLVESNEKPGTNVSGTNDMSPIKEQIELMLKFAPETKTVGVVYASSEDNAVLQVESLRSILKEKGLACIEQTVTTSNDVQQAVQSIVEKCDAIYIPTDNILASAMPIVADVTKTAKIPVICSEENQVTMGGLATIGLNYFNLGYQTGEMAVRVLKGEDISAMPIESLKKYNYSINLETAKAIGIEIPKELAEFAK